MEKEARRNAKEALVKSYREANRTALKGQTVFTGSSLMEMFPIEPWIKELGESAPVVYNRGVGGYQTEDLLLILDACVFDLEPAKVFINIGTNDLGVPERTVEEMIGNYDRILTQIENRLPGVKIYLMAYYPVNFQAAAEEVKPLLQIRSNEKVALANEQVKALAKRHGQRYIDVSAPLKDADGNLKAEYTVEGLHIKPEGYRAIFADVMRYVRE